MKIKFERIQQLLLAMAAETGQAAAAAMITEKYHQLGAGRLPLVPGETWNNQQNIFHRWLKGETRQQREKLFELLPAILELLPDDMAAQLLAAESVEYRALSAAERSLREAKSAFMKTRRALFIQEYRSGRNGGPAGSCQLH